MNTRSATPCTSGAPAALPANFYHLLSPPWFGWRSVKSQAAEKHEGQLLHVYVLRGIVLPVELRPRVCVYVWEEMGVAAKLPAKH